MQSKTHVGGKAITKNLETRSVVDFLSLPLSDFIRESYSVFLGRRPENFEMNAQSIVLATGLSRPQFLTDISQSTEFRSRDNHLMEDSEDDAFLQHLYVRYLGRDVDIQGLEHYLRLLTKGRSRQRVRRDVANSPEARTRATFWYALEELIARELRGRHWFWRWFSQARLAAQRNSIAFEALHRTAIRSERVHEHSTQPRNSLSGNAIRNADQPFSDGGIDPELSSRSRKVLHLFQRHIDFKAI